MPRGWMLVNDGYGCGYGEGPVSFPSNLTDLAYVVEELHSRGLYTGLWTSTGMPHIDKEVGACMCTTCVYVHARYNMTCSPHHSTLQNGSQHMALPAGR